MARHSVEYASVNHDEVIEKYNIQIDELKNNFRNLQVQFTAVKLALDHENETIALLQKQLENSQSHYILVSNDLAILQSILKSCAKNTVKEYVSFHHFFGKES